MGRKLKYTEGMKCGGYTIIKKINIPPKNDSYLCLCTCGKQKIISTFVLKRNLYGCGKCANKYKDNTGKVTHGCGGSKWKVTRSKEYAIWGSMIARCYNKNSQRFIHYGGRGISVCAEWRLFENFLKDMGVRPEGMSLDRIDNNGNYELKNCRWADVKTQARNKSSNRYFTQNGETKCIAEWCEFLGLRKKTIYGRLAKGWTEEQALTTSISNFR